jgi:hypothetical protein
MGENGDDGWLEAIAQQITVGCPTMVWLFLVVHVTALGAYGHLRHSLRKEVSLWNTVLGLFFFICDPA